MKNVDAELFHTPKDKESWKQNPAWLHSNISRQNNFVEARKPRIMIYFLPPYVCVSLPHSKKETLIKFFWCRYGTHKCFTWWCLQTYFLSSSTLRASSISEWSKKVERLWYEFDNLHVLSSLPFPFTSWRFSSCRHMPPPQIALAYIPLHMNMTQQETIKISNNLMAAIWLRCLYLWVGTMMRMPCLVSCSSVTKPLPSLIFPVLSYMFVL